MRLSRISAVLSVGFLASVSFLSQATFGQLLNLGLEDSLGPQGWAITTSITGEPGTPISLYEHVGQANNLPATPGELGIFIKPYAGNVGTFLGQNKMTNFNMQQTFTFGAAAAGRTYTFKGDAFFQAAASNILENLIPAAIDGDFNENAVVDAADFTVWRDNFGGDEGALNGNGDDSGTVDQGDYDLWKTNFGMTGGTGGPSPTESYFRMEFLNSSDVVVGMFEQDLRVGATPEEWKTYEVVGLAPATTQKVRVSVDATNMVASCSGNCPAGQDFDVDNFSLRDSTAAVLERLVNGNLNTLGAPSGWSVEKTPEDNLSFSGSPTFAAHTGNVGMWLRSFAGGDAKIIQTIDATAGAEYDLSAWVKFQQGYNGLDPFSDTQTFLTIEFLDGSEAVLETESLDLRTVDELVLASGEGMGQGAWVQVSVPTATAPVGTVSARISAGATMMASSGINPQSAFFDDFSLIETLPGGGGFAVPEPSTSLLIGLAMAILGLRRRKR